VTDWGKSIICEFTFPVCNRTLKFTVAADYNCCDSFVYYITVYNGYKPRQNGELHKKIFYVSQERFYRLLNAHGKKLGLNFDLRRMNMTNRFEFRTWYKKNYIYKNLCDAHYYTDEGKCIGSANNLPNDLLWEQCTGLKDKNGRLIYDGDYIRAINQDTKDKPDLQFGHIWVDELNCRWVKFDKEELSWNDFCSLIDYDLTLEIEVIGNEHQGLGIKEIVDD